MTNTLRLTFLGTGTSQGVPVIGCKCEVCTSEDPRDKRLRVSVLVESATTTISVDAGPDFRQQMLRAGVDKLDAVLLTHEHNDHVIGMDDVRPFNFRRGGGDMPIYALPRVADAVKQRFAYAFDAEPYPGAPRFDLREIDGYHPFSVGDIPVEPVHLLHGRLPILGYRFGDIAYLTDTKTISEPERMKVRGCKVLIVNALHHYTHHSHLNLKEALALIDDLAPERAFLTHCSHYMGRYDAINPTLPQGVALAWDGLVLEV